MTLTTRTRTLVLLAAIMLLTTACVTRTPQPFAESPDVGTVGTPNPSSMVSYERLSSDSLLTITRMIDRKIGTVCYLFTSYKGVAVSCLPLEATNAP